MQQPNVAGGQGTSDLAAEMASIGQGPQPPRVHFAEANPSSPARGVINEHRSPSFIPANAQSTLEQTIGAQLHEDNPDTEAVEADIRDRRNENQDHEDDEQESDYDEYWEQRIDDINNKIKIMQEKATATERDTAYAKGLAEGNANKLATCNAKHASFQHQIDEQKQNTAIEAGLAQAKFDRLREDITTCETQCNSYQQTCIDRSHEVYTSVLKRITAKMEVFSKEYEQYSKKVKEHYDSKLKTAYQEILQLKQDVQALKGLRPSTVVHRIPSPCNLAPPRFDPDREPSVYSIPFDPDAEQPGTAFPRTSSRQDRHSDRETRPRVSLATQQLCPARTDVSSSSDGNESDRSDASRKRRSRSTTKKKNTSDKSNQQSKSKEADKTCTLSPVQINAKVKKHAGAFAEASAKSSFKRFIDMFEFTLRNYYVPEADWAEQLGLALEGQAAEVWMTVPEEQQRDYHFVKEHLHSCFPSKTKGAAEYRNDWESLRQKSNQSYDKLRAEMERLAGLALQDMGSSALDREKRLKWYKAISDKRISKMVETLKPATFAEAVEETKRLTELHGPSRPPAQRSADNSNKRTKGRSRDDSSFAEDEEQDDVDSSFLSTDNPSRKKKKNKFGGGRGRGRNGRGRGGRPGNRTRDNNGDSARRAEDAFGGSIKDEPDSRDNRGRETGNTGTGFKPRKPSVECICNRCGKRGHRANTCNNEPDPDWQEYIRGKYGDRAGAGTSNGDGGTAKPGTGRGSGSPQMKAAGRRSVYTANSPTKSSAHSNWTSSTSEARFSVANAGRAKIRQIATDAVEHHKCEQRLANLLSVYPASPAFLLHVHDVPCVALSDSGAHFTSISRRLAEHLQERGVTTIYNEPEDVEVYNGGIVRMEFKARVNVGTEDQAIPLICFVAEVTEFDLSLGNDFLIATGIKIDWEHFTYQLFDQDFDFLTLQDCDEHFAKSDEYFEQLDFCGASSPRSQE